MALEQLGSLGAQPRHGEAENDKIGRRRVVGYQLRKINVGVGWEDPDVARADRNPSGGERLLDLGFLTRSPFLGSGDQDLDFGFLPVRVAQEHVGEENHQACILVVMPRQPDVDPVTVAEEDIGVAEHHDVHLGCCCEDTAVVDLREDLGGVLRRELEEDGVVLHAGDSGDLKALGERRAHGRTDDGVHIEPARVIAVELVEVLQGPLCLAVGIRIQESRNEVEVGPDCMSVAQPGQELEGGGTIKGTTVDHDDARPPLVRRSLIAAGLKTDLHLAGGLDHHRTENSAEVIAVFIPRRTDDAVEQGHGDDRHQRVDRVHLEHEQQTADGAQEAQVPARVEGRPVARSGRKVLEERDGAQGPVGDHEEHGDDPGDEVDISCGNKGDGDGAGDDRGVAGFIGVAGAAAQKAGDGLPSHHPVFSDGLEGAGRHQHRSKRR